MLKYFNVISFRNLYLGQGIRLSSDMNFVYGNCASGKTNLCLAINDFRNEIYVGNFFDKVAKFFYVFYVLEFEIHISYERSRMNGINNMKIEIPAISFEHMVTGKLARPSDIFIKEACRGLPECILQYMGNLNDSKALVVIDDFDSEADCKYRWNDLSTQSNKQHILVVRRSWWIDCKYVKDMKYIFYIKNGQVMKIQDYGKKDITQFHKMRNIYIKT